MAACRDQAKPSPRLAGLLLAVGFALSEKGWSTATDRVISSGSPGSLAWPDQRGGSFDALVVRH